MIIDNIVKILTNAELLASNGDCTFSLDSIDPSEIVFLDDLKSGEWSVVYLVLIRGKKYVMKVVCTA